MFWYGKEEVKDVIMDLIEKTMMPKVLEAHTANQDELLRLHH